MLHVSKKDFLSTAPDYIINLTTLVPDSLSFTEPGVQPLLGSLGAEAFISAMNLTASIISKKEEATTKTDWKAYQGHICKACTKIKNILKHNVKDGDSKNILKNNIEDGDVPQRLIFPIVRGPPDNPGHFSVTCFDFSVNDPEFFVNVIFFDSLVRARKRIHRCRSAAAIVEKVNFFFRFYILHEAKFQCLHQSDADLLQCAEYKGCPRQDNGYNCGIFTVAVVLHHLEQRVVDKKAFTQSDMSQKLEKLLATALINVKFPSRLHTCDVFRNCFPLLQVAEGSSSSTPIIDCTDDLERVVSGPLPVGAVDNKKRTDGDEDDDMALLTWHSWC